ncbi:MAG TPA: APC family permease, partial [Trichormus sp.]
MITQIKKLLFGSPLDTKSELQERLDIFLGLAIFASDALSSSAYATDETLFALVGAISVSTSQPGLLSDHTFDAGNLYLCVPVACMIAMLLGIVIVSYRQVINAYPDGGGAYVVAKENLGTRWSLLAAASLMLDYVLTVAVSVSAGVAAITATFHATNAAQAVVEEHTSMTFAVITILAIMHMNLRGIKESARVIAIPAYLFIASMIGLIVIGVFRTLVFEHHGVEYHGVQIGVEHIAVGLLFLKAFAHGCAALTGIEAISNGVKAFKEPSEVTANKTMVLMGAILAFIFIGLTYLALAYQIIPVEGDTVVSQVARAVFGGQNLLYYFVQWTTMTILVLAANTSFGGFPRLAMLLARDGYLPRQLMNVGDRLVYSNGVVLLASMACLLVLAFHASVHNLMPMYAIGVFLSFTLAQAGMVTHHKRKNEGKDGYRRMTINTVGAIATGAVCVLLCLEKFTAGAWIVLIALPVLMWTFNRINNHYRTTSALLSLPKDGYHPR